MKPNTYPEYKKVLFMNTKSGFKFLTGSKKWLNETIEWEDGHTYPLIKVEVSSDLHPFYTGRQKFADRGGRADRFMQKYSIKQK
ncbi:type B 50S ribosomal protein L31 [Bacillus sp. CGMCC 1.16541]|uniref:type B 50S ribosomal protein L31 n=1 Tax=Bacillus sp. CGMCC 1.16541 TaxID=2185143 RepID=UPI000D72C089|nr:type B 50S ribosomal protein L31 [Bacillus sp. CGMCC 1.16541]